MRYIVLAPLAALFLAACQPAAETGPEAAAPVQGAASEPAAAAPAPEAPAASARAEKPEQPSLIVETIDHGTFDLSAQRGQWVVVNFWATWCAPCLKEIPDLNSLDAEHENVRVVGLAYEEITAEAMRAFYAEKVKPEYPVAIVDVYKPPADFDTPRGLPFTVLIDPAGKVAHKFLGPVTSKDILEKIAAVSPAA